MVSFIPYTLYRVQICPCLDSSGRPVDVSHLRELFSFDDSGNAFVFVNDFQRFVDYIKSKYSGVVFVKSIGFISDDLFIYVD